MHRLICFLVGLLLATSAWAETYRLKDGRSLTGDPVSYTDRGLTVKTAGGDYPRTEWDQFTQATLRELRSNPEAAPFVEPLIEMTSAEREAAANTVQVQAVDRLDRPTGRTGFIGMFFSTGLGWFLLLLIYVGNLFAAYEVALFRVYPRQMVFGIAAVAPWIGPAVLFAIPRRLIMGDPPKSRLDTPIEEEEWEEVDSEAEAEAAAAAEAEAAAAAEAAEPTLPEPIVYARGAVTFNRRFFETKLNKFMKIPKPEDVADLVLLIKSPRGDHQSTHITKLDQAEFTYQITKGEAKADVTVPYLELQEVTVKHKELL